jgi:hypothetical protein
MVRWRGGPTECGSWISLPLPRPPTSRRRRRGLGTRVLRGGASSPPGRGRSRRLLIRVRRQGDLRGDRERPDRRGLRHRLCRGRRVRPRRARGGRHSGGLGRRGRRGSLAPRPAYPCVRDQALRSPRRVERELVPGGTAAGRGRRRARSHRGRSGDRRHQPRGSGRHSQEGRSGGRTASTRRSGGEATAKADVLGQLESFAQSEGMPAYGTSCKRQPPLAASVALPVRHRGVSYSSGIRSAKNSTRREAAGGSRLLPLEAAAIGLSRRPQASELAGAMIASSRSRLAAGHRAFES